MIDFVLSESEGRVLGALLEKSLATPEYYPLSLNALLNACNQKSNREPVVSYDETTVLGAIDSLKGKQLVVQGDSSRVAKYAECFVGNAKLIIREAALICLLLLRGPQTVGELRGRSERLHAFADLEEVKETLDSLVEMGIVRKMARQPGRKEARFMHLLAGEFVDSNEAMTSSCPDNSAGREEFSPGRLVELQEEIRLMRKEIADLQQEFREFKEQFE